MLAGSTTEVLGEQFGYATLLSAASISLTGLSPSIGRDYFPMAGPISSGGASAPTALVCNYLPQSNNLVQDGSFECPASCPTLAINATLNSGPNSYWRTATSGTPDYYHSCDDVTRNFSVPNNVATANGLSRRVPLPAMAQHVTTLNGDAYIGLHTNVLVQTGPNPTNAAGIREYAMEQLAGPIQGQQRYYAEFYTSIAPAAGWSAQSIGMALINDDNQAGFLNQFLTNTPVIQGVPSNVVGWQRIGGVFTAGGSLATPRIILGNFALPVPNTALINQLNNGPTANTGSPVPLVARSYYLIDNVLLSPLTEAGPSYSLSCNNASSLQLGTAPLPSQTGATYQWVASPADPSLTAAAAQTANPTVRPLQTTTYTLTVTIPARAAGPSMLASPAQSFPGSSCTITRGPATAGPNQTIGCGGGQVMLQVQCPQPGVTYTWTDSDGYSQTTTGSTPVPVHPFYTTTYTLTASGGTIGMPNSTTVTTTAPTAGSERVITCGTSTLLTVQCPSGDPNVQYQWVQPGVTPLAPSHGNTSLSVSPTATTQYTLRIYFSGVLYSIKTVRVVVIPSAVPTLNVACGSTAPLPTCGAGTGLANAVYYWTLPGQNAVVQYGGLNPVVPAVATTLQLNVLYNGVVYTANAAPYLTTVTVNNGQPCIPPIPPACVHNYAAQPQSAANPNRYTASRHLSGSVNNYDLGVAGQITTVDGAAYPGKTVIFDGVYHVRGSIEFKEGSFFIKPGTVFYIDGQTNTNLNHCAPATNLLDRYTQLGVVQNAHLYLQGATLTATCQSMWGGVEVRDGGQLETSSGLDPVTGQLRRSEISQARIGLVLGSPCSPAGVADSYYRIKETNFLNDTYGVTQLGNGAPHLDVEGVMNCTFSSTLAERLYPDNGASVPGPAGGVNSEYTRTGLLLWGPQHKNVSYQGNAFNSLYVGAEVAGDGVDLRQNTFEHNYGASIRVGSPTVHTFLDRVDVRQNSITVPDNATPLGQVAAGATVYGIQLLEHPDGGDQLHIEQNAVYGENNIGHAQKPKVGLYGGLKFNKTFVQKQNQWLYLDRGIELMDASSQVGSVVIADNYLAQNDKCIVLDGGGSATFTPTIECNRMDESQGGIYVASGADVGDLGVPAQANANQYLLSAANYNKAVVNDGSNAIKYYAFSGEIPSVGGNPYAGTIVPAGGLSCGSRPSYDDNTHYQFGLRQQLSGTSSIEEQIQKLLEAHDSPLVLHQVEEQLIRYCEQTEDLTPLVSLSTSLMGRNDASFVRLSLYLMEHFRRTGQDAAAQDSRAQLIGYLGQEDEVSRRVAYFDVVGRLHQAPGQRPSVVDSTTLGTIAASASDYAPMACATLSYYYPTTTCTGGSSRGVSSNRLASSTSHSPMRQILRLLSYPNPAHEVVEVELVGGGALPTTANFQLVELATGRVMQTQSISSSGRLVLDVRHLAAGVYAGRLLQGTELLSTCKLVVIH
jgi:hypothetical protein